MLLLQFQTVERATVCMACLSFSRRTPCASSPVGARVELAPPPGGGGLGRLKALARRGGRAIEELPRHPTIPLLLSGRKCL